MKRKLSLFLTIVVMLSLMTISVNAQITTCNVTIGAESEPEVPGADASVISYQVTKGDGGKFSLRVISGLNSLEYSHYGYEITVTTKDESGNDVVQTFSGKDYKIYSSIYGGTTAYSIKDNFGYEYAALATVTGLAANSAYTKLEISTYVVSKGEKIYGSGATLLYTGIVDADGYPDIITIYGNGDGNQGEWDPQAIGDEFVF